MVDFRQPEMLLFLVATIGVTPSAEETSWYNWTGFWLPWSTVPGKPTDILFFSPTCWHHIGTEFYNSHERIAFAVSCWITVLCGSQTNRKRYALIWQLCFELCFALLWWGVLSRMRRQAAMTVGTGGAMPRPCSNTRETYFFSGSKRKSWVPHRTRVEEFLTLLMHFEWLRVPNNNNKNLTTHFWCFFLGAFRGNVAGICLGGKNTGAMMTISLWDLWVQHLGVGEQNYNIKTTSLSTERKGDQACDETCASKSCASSVNNMPRTLAMRGSRPIRWRSCAMA